MNFASWLLNPWMLGLSAIAVAVPIIIHLLNKRRFKIVDWAAMDFLLDADKKNRRRVRLENLILLLLRCLAMLLIGLILARPFLPSHLAKVLAENQQYEWVVWLDDSLSHQVQVDQATLFDGAKESLKSLLQRGVQSDSEETLTLFLTSQADKPVISNKPIRADSIAELTRAIDELRCSDWSADYPVALEDLQRYLSGQREDVNRVAYIFSDLRIRDWASAQTEKAPNETLKKIAELPAMAGCFVVDSGSDWWDNVAISQVQAEDMQVANTVIRFAATVANHGPAIARDVAVRFQVGDEAPQINRIAELAPGQVTIVTFPHMFNAALAEGDDPDAAEPLANVSYHKIRVELAPEANRSDALSSDNGFDYVAPTWRGIPVLFVDGEPNVVPERSEVYFLSATEVKGTGLLADAVTHTEFESISLSKYKVIFLCNVGEVSRDRLVALEQWVRNGGGLVLWPGAQVRATPFNEAFFRDGQGLSPFGLVAEQGDSQRLNYAGFELAPGGHAALRVSLSLPNIFNSLKIYKWWGTALAEGDLGKDVAVPLRLTDENRSIAMAERSVGRGRVVGFTFPADLDWTDWPPHPSYAPVIFDLIQYLAARDIRTESVRVGGSFTHLVDLSAFDANFAFVDPAGEMTESLARPITSSDEATQSVLYQARLDQLRNRGFYQLKLTRGDGRFQPVLFAANIDPGESQLRRLDFQEVGESYFGDRVKRLTLAELDALEISGGRNEIWLQVLAALAAVLLIEQLLGWWFGRRRSGS